MTDTIKLLEEAKHHAEQAEMASDIDGTMLQSDCVFIEFSMKNPGHAADMYRVDGPLAEKLLKIIHDYSLEKSRKAMSDALMASNKEK